MVKHLAPLILSFVLLLNFSANKALAYSPAVTNLPNRQIAGVQTASIIDDVWNVVQGIQTSLQSLLDNFSLDKILTYFFETNLQKIIAWFTEKSLTVSLNLIKGRDLNLTDAQREGTSYNNHFFAGTLAGNTFNQPEKLYPRSNEYLAQAINENFFGIKSANAQLESGRNIFSRSGIQSLWEVMRNLAYIAVVIILVVYGFLIMFQHKIDPRTVVTVQSAIPSLAIGLVLIAFSFIVPALFIDLSRVLIFTTDKIFTPLRTAGTQDLCASNPNDKGLWNRYVNTGGSQTVGSKDPFECLPIQISYIQAVDHLDVNAGMIYDLGVPNNLLRQIFQWAAEFVVWYAYLQIFFTVIMRITYLVVRTIFAPLIIAVGIIPGKQSAVLRWALSTLADALSIAGIYFMMNVAMYLWALSNFGARAGPPFNGGPALRVLDILPSQAGLSPTNNILWIISIAVVMLASKIPALLEEAFDIVPSGHSSRAGVDFAAAARRTPIIGGFLG